MLGSIYSVLQCHALLNQLRVHREFYSAEMMAGERMLSYINGVPHFSSLLKSMGVDIDKTELGMDTLNGLPGRCKEHFTTLDAVGDDSSASTLVIADSRLLQEKQ